MAMMESRDLLIDAFGRIPDEVRLATEHLGADALSWRPDADANSIAWLVWHLTRVQDDHVSDLAGIEQAYVADGWADRFGLPPDVHDIGYGHTTEQVAAVRVDAPDLLVAYFEAVHARTGDYLTTIDSAELDRICDTRWDPPVTVGVRLVSVINDCYQHVGQARYVRGLWERR